MKIEVIDEKRLNHIHYCRIHKENNQLSGSFWFLPNQNLRIRRCLVSN